MVCSVPDHLVEDPPGLLRHPEAAGTERFVDVLRRGARQRDLEVVDDAGAVHRQRRHVAALHQVDEHRRHAGLDHVRADAPDDAGLSRARVDDGAHDATKVLSAENAGSESNHALNDPPGALGLREILRACLASSRCERVRPHAGEIELFVGEWHGQYVISHVAP